MAKFIANDVSLTVGGTDLSEWTKSVKVNEQWDDRDVTGMGAAAKEHLLGIPDASIEVEFFQDFASSATEDTLSAIKGSNTPTEIVVKPTSAGVGSDNPSYTMQGVLPEYDTLDANVGAESTIKVKFLNADPSGIVKATS